MKADFYKATISFPFLAAVYIVSPAIAAPTERILYVEPSLSTWSVPAGEADRLLIVADSLHIEGRVQMNLPDQIGLLAVAVNRLDVNCGAQIDISGKPPRKFLLQINEMSGCTTPKFTVNLPRGKRGLGSRRSQSFPWGRTVGPCEIRVGTQIVTSAKPGMEGVPAIACSPPGSDISNTVQISSPGGPPGDNGLSNIEDWIARINADSNDASGKLPGDQQGWDGYLPFLQHLRDIVKSDACANYYATAEFSPRDGLIKYEDYGTCFNREPDDYYWVARSAYFTIVSRATYETAQALAGGDQIGAYKVSRSVSELRPAVPLKGEDQLLASKLMTDAAITRTSLGNSVSYKLASTRISPLDNRPSLVLDVKSLDSFLLPTALLPKQIDAAGRLATMRLGSSDVEIGLDVALANSPPEVEQADAFSHTTTKTTGSDSSWSLTAISTPDADAKFAQLGNDSLALRLVVSRDRVAKVMAGLISDDGLPLQLSWEYDNGVSKKNYTSLAYLSFQKSANPALRLKGDELVNDAPYSLRLGYAAASNRKAVWLGCVIAPKTSVKISICAPDLSVGIASIFPSEISSYRPDPEVIGQYMIAPVTDGQIVDYSISCDVLQFNAFLNAQLKKVILSIEVNDRDGPLKNLKLERNSCEGLRPYNFSLLLRSVGSTANLKISGEFSYSDGSTRLFGPVSTGASGVAISEIDLK